MKTVRVEIERLPSAEGLGLPEYATAGSAGMDLQAAVDVDLDLAPGARALIPTGLRIALPDGWEAQIRPRSGLALRHGVTVLNAPGTIDSDYRGEIGVILANLGELPFTVSRGMRMAQLVVAPVARVAWQEVKGGREAGLGKAGLAGTARGSGGFGSTGTRAARTGAAGTGAAGTGTNGTRTSGLRS